MTSENYNHLVSSAQAWVTWGEDMVPLLWSANGKNKLHFWHSE